MQLKIENLGQIKSVTIDLDKNFTLFCGPNSTGKTYLSYILNAFCGKFDFTDHGYISKLAEDAVKNGYFDIKIEDIKEWLRYHCEYISSSIEEIFGISDATKKAFFQDFKLFADYSEEDYRGAVNSGLEAKVRFNGWVFNFSKPGQNASLRIDVNADLAGSKPRPTMLLHIAIYDLIRHFALKGISGARMLTVERNSIYTFKTELSLSRNELIDRLQQKSDLDGPQILDILHTASRRYPWAVTQSLRIANDLSNIQKQNSKYATIAEDIEKDILHGEVHVNREGDVEFHDKNMAKNKRLPFHISSSIVKTMACLIFYLRHIAKDNDVLIIDEPEMNFHPDVQVALARIMADMSNMGLHVIVSTHSDYIIREINNLIMGYYVDNQVDGDSVIKALGFQKNQLLDPRNAEVFYFIRKNTRRVEVIKVPIDKTGFVVPSIDATIDVQSSAMARLYSALE